MKRTSVKTCALRSVVPVVAVVPIVSIVPVVPVVHLL